MSAILFLLVLPMSVSADSYNVKIVTSQHVNLVDSRFLSFTVDPKYLFSNNDKYASKECICMASALTPAYLRIAGPSTSHMTFHNTTISINDVDFGLQNPDSSDFDTPKKFPFDWRTKNLAVSYRQWKKFVHWTKAVGFDLVFALNNEEKTRSGMWDANTALNMLTVAERAKVGHIFWELGYECSNQSIEEYLNDLETLSVIIETFPPGRTGEWKVVGGDVTKCLQADSKSDFKDYITLSNDKLDALLLNGNSSSHELERMSERDRLKLLHLLSRSETPLWLTETNQRQYSGVIRAADWLASLGYAAKNGFSVHYRELEEDELYEPTLSFYMALLFKNLVGERVLDVQMDPEQAIMFAHCTSLRHKPIPGAVTLFGANIDDEPARFSLKLSKREEGGDIMQFILGLDRNGNIEVNGRVMYYEGDIKPVVKRVPPYKSLLINLPAKSFGFWVLANTKIEACHNVDTNQTVFEAETITNNRKKRSNNNDFEDLTKSPDVSYDFEDNDTLLTNNKAIKSRISDLNKDLSKIHNIFKYNRDRTRVKREEDSYIPKKLKRQSLRYREKWDDDITPKRLIGNLLEKARQSVSNIKNTIGISKSKLLNRNRLNKRHSKTSRLNKRRKFDKTYNRNKAVSRKPKAMIKNRNNEEKNEISKNRKERNMHKTSSETQEKINKTPNASKISEENTVKTETRKKRSIKKDVVEISAENHLDYDSKDKEKLWKLFKKIHRELEEENANDSTDSRIVSRTELTDDKATIHVQDSNHGILKSTVRNLLNVFEDLNTNVNKLWNAVDLLD